MSSQEGGAKYNLELYHLSLVGPIRRLLKMFFQLLVYPAKFLVNLWSAFGQFVSCTTWPARLSRFKTQCGPSHKIFYQPWYTQYFLLFNYLLKNSHLILEAVRRGRADWVETAPKPDTTLYQFYCSENTFMLFHVAAKTTIRSLQQVTL